MKMKMVKAKELKQISYILTNGEEALERALNIYLKHIEVKTTL